MILDTAILNNKTNLSIAGHAKFWQYEKWRMTSLEGHSNPEIARECHLNF